MKRTIRRFVIFTIMVSLLAGLSIPPQVAAAGSNEAYGLREIPFSLAPHAFTFPNEGFIEYIAKLEVDDLNNLYVLANEPYLNKKDIFHFTTDGDFLGRLITRDALAAQLIGASWHTSGGVPEIEPLQIAFSKEGTERYLYIVLKGTNSKYPLIKLDLANNTVVEDSLAVFTSGNVSMQKEKDGLLYVLTGEWKAYATLDPTNALPTVTTISAQVNDYIWGIALTADDRYLVKGGLQHYICDDPSLSTCTTLQTQYRYSKPFSSENGAFAAIGALKDWDNYIVLNENKRIKIDQAFSLDTSALAFTNQGDLIEGSRDTLRLFPYNASEQTYGDLIVLNSNRGEVYTSEYVQFFVNPVNGHYVVADSHSRRIDEFDEQGIYIRSKKHIFRKAAFHDGYIFVLLNEGAPNMGIMAATDFSLLRTVAINPRDMLWTPTGQFLAIYDDRLEQYAWNTVTKELNLEHTYPVGGNQLNMHGDGKQITFTEKVSQNVYVLDLAERRYTGTTYQPRFGHGVIERSGLFIHHDWINLSIQEPNYGIVFQTQDRLYNDQWSYAAPDTYIVPKKVYDPVLGKYKLIPVRVQMTKPDSTQETSFTSIAQPQKTPATRIAGQTINLGIDFPFNGATVDEIKIIDEYGSKKLFFTNHPYTGIVVPQSSPDAIYHAVVGSEVGKRMAVIQFSNAWGSWNKGTLQVIFFEETGEIVVQAEAHQPTTTDISVYMFRLLENQGTRYFPSGVAKSVNLVNDAFIANHGRAYVPIFLQTGNTLTDPTLTTPADNQRFDANEDHVMLEWVNNNNSADYDRQYLLFSTDASFTKYKQLDVTGQTSYNLNTNALIPGIPYYWKVLTVKRSTAEIAMSETRQFAFTNWSIDLTVNNASYTEVPVQVTLETLNLNFIRQAGVAVSTSPFPTVADEWLAIAAPYATGMSGTLKGLQPDTTYYARAFATDGSGTRYSKQVSFTTKKFVHPLQLANVPFAPSVTDTVYAATVPYEVSATKATYDSAAGFTSAELWVEGSAYAWDTDIPLRVGLNTIASRFVDHEGTHDSTVLVTRETARLAAAPTNVMATAGNGSATVRFDAPTDYGSYPLQKYVVTSQPGNILAEGMGTEIEVSGLSNGTSYRFKVHAVTAAGTGAESALSDAVTPSAGSQVPQPPQPPIIEYQPTPSPVTEQVTFDIWINGEGVKATKLNGEWVIQSTSEEADITLEISQQAWTELFVPQGFVQLEHQGIVYRFPAEEIMTDAMEQQLDLSEDTAYQIVLQLQVENKKLQSGTLPAGVVSSGQQINLKLEIQAGDKTVPIDRFHRFAQLRFPIGSAILTTAVRLDEGEIVHIPTKFITENGQRFVELSLISNGSFTMIRSARSFNDLAQHWAEPQIQDLANRRVIEGFPDGSFQPNQWITRGQLAVLTARVLGLGKVGYTDRFKDVDATAWYADELEATVAFDLLQGYEDGSFQAERLVTREQAIVVLNRIAKLTGIIVPKEEAHSALNAFVDADELSVWAREDVGAAIAAGIIHGRDNGNLAPQDWMTRAELSAILHRWLLHTKRQS